MAYKDKAKEKEYKRKYHQEHKEQKRQYYKQYYLDARDEILAQEKEYRKTHKEREAKRHRQYEKEHKVEKKEYHKKYYLINRDRILERCKQYRKEHKDTEKYKAQSCLEWHRRQARIKNLGYSFSLEEWNDCKDYFNHECAYCGKKLHNLAQDHVIPVIKGGSYTRNNIIPACKSCNSKKNSTDLEEWYLRHAFYSKERLLKIQKYLQEIKNE